MNVEQQRSREHKCFKAGVGVMYFILAIWMLSIGCSFLVRSFDYSFYLTWSVPKYNSVANENIPIVGKDPAPLEVKSYAYQLYLALSFFPSAIIYAAFGGWMISQILKKRPVNTTNTQANGKNNAWISRAFSTGPSELISMPDIISLPPDDYHGVVLAMTRFFPDIFMGLIVFNSMSEKGGVVAMNMAGVMLSFQVCYLLGEAYYHNLYARYIYIFTPVVTLSNYLLLIMMVGLWVFAMIAVILPLRISDGVVSIPSNVRTPFIIFMTKLAFDSCIHLYNVLMILKTMTCGNVQLENEYKSYTSKYIFIHVVNCVLTGLFFIYSDHSLETCGVSGF